MSTNKQICKYIKNGTSQRHLQLLTAISPLPQYLDTYLNYPYITLSAGSQLLSLSICKPLSILPKKRYLGSEVLPSNLRTESHFDRKLEPIPSKIYSFTNTVGKYTLAYTCILKLVTLYKSSNLDLFVVNAVLGCCAVRT